MLMANRAYLLIEPVRKLFDGWYMNSEVARASLKYKSENYPDERWIMVQSEESFDIKENISLTWHLNGR